MTHSDRDEDPVKELVQQHWNGRAATFDGESQHGIHNTEQHERWLSILREWTGNTPLQVLDVGCGTGVISLLLGELGHNVTGVDFAPRMLQQARTKATQTDQSIEFYRGDAESLAITDNAFDLVTARHLVWTLPNPEMAISEWKRVVEPGGRILLIEGYWDHSEPWDEYKEVHGNLPVYDGKTPEEMREVLVEAGLQAVKYEHDQLMDSVLWGREPQFDYYIMTGEVPGCGRP